MNSFGASRLFALSFLLCLAGSGSLHGADPAVERLLADATDVGLKAGAIPPAIQLEDQNGKRRDLASLMGPKGLVLVFFRSADW